MAAGAAAAASAAAFGFGVPVLTPTLRDEYELSVGEIGLVLGASWVGSCLTLLPWGLAADRFGERLVLSLGLGASAAGMAGAAYAPSLAALLAVLALTGAAGASVASASGRAVMHWFGPDERGLALGVRQTAVPLGGLVAALALPSLAERGGLRAAFLFLAAIAALGALVGALVLREAARGFDGIEADTVVRTLRDRRLWRICFGSGLYLYAQVAVIGFGVLFLVDEHGFSRQSAALVFAGGQVLAAAFRIGGGRWSDVIGARIVPLRRIGIAIAAVMVVTTFLAGGPSWLLVPVLILAGGLTMAWNGLSFTAAAELAGALRSGAAIGVQQTVLAATGIVAPIVFGVTVSSGSWTIAFAVAAAMPLAGWWLLGPLSERRHTARP